MLNAHAAYITHLLFSYAWSQLTCLAIGVLFSGPGRDIGPVWPCMCVCVCARAGYVERARYIHHSLTIQLRMVAAHLPCYWCSVSVSVSGPGRDIGSACLCVRVCVSAWEMLSAHAAYITLYLLFSISATHGHSSLALLLMFC